MRYTSIVVLTGSGVSAESGIRTFRASDGLWENHPVEDVATPEGYARNPALVQRFYNDRRRQLNSVKPNRAHQVLAAFERHFSGSFLLVTQNVDDLHERAGSNRLIHMHGELLKVHCQETGRFFIGIRMLPSILPVNAAVLPVIFVHILSGLVRCLYGWMRFIRHCPSVISLFPLVRQETSIPLPGSFRRLLLQEQRRLN